jgi:hypothetical protein
MLQLADLDVETLMHVPGSGYVIIIAGLNCLKS